MSFIGSRTLAKSAGFACLMLLTMVQGVWAQVTPAQQSAIRSSCRSDFMSKCSGVTPGGVEALQCLQKNVAALSAGCKSAVSDTLPKPTPASAAPSPPPPPPPPPATAAPLTQPAAPAIVTAKPPAATMPSGKPAQAMPAPMPAQTKPAASAKPTAAPAAADTPPPPTAAQMNAIRNTCRGDFSRNCKGVSPGGPEAIACLQSNAAKLSPNCQTSLADVADGAAVMPPAAPTAPPPPPAARRPNAPVVMTAVIGRACMRDLIRRCRNTGVGDGQKIACLQANEADLAPLCKAALKGTAPIR